MINIQDKIEAILLNTELSKSERIKEIHLLLNNCKYDYLCDFDDTITDNKCLLYSKYNYLKKRGLGVGKLYKDFDVNKRFLSYFKNKPQLNFIILSSNNLYFIKEIVNRNMELFNSTNINIVGIIGSVDGLKVEIGDKMEAIPEGKIYVSDIMEYLTFKGKNNYVCIDKYSYFNYIKIICMKVFYYLYFILKNV